MVKKLPKKKKKPTNDLSSIKITLSIYIKRKADMITSLFCLASKQNNLLWN